MIEEKQACGGAMDWQASFDANVSPRKREILEVAARLFARKGYRDTSMRDIGDKAGVQGGSLYHHIRSKDALFVELHNAALDTAAARIAHALDGVGDPWERLRVVCRVMLDVQLDPESLTMPLMNDFREVPPEVRAQLITRRDAFEDIFRELVGGLPLPEWVDRSIYRNMLLSQLNAASGWYRAGRLSSDQIADQIAGIFQHA